MLQKKPHKIEHTLSLWETWAWYALASLALVGMVENLNSLIKMLKIVDSKMLHKAYLDTDTFFF